MKQFGLSTEELIVAWKTMIRPITEYAAPLWHSGLTDAQNNQIESLQKKALSMIMGKEYIDHKKYYKYGKDRLCYEDVLVKVDLVPLKNRRATVTDRFTLDSCKNKRHNDMFPKKHYERASGRTRVQVQEKLSRTKRYYKSAGPHMLRTLNGISMCT